MVPAMKLYVLFQRGGYCDESRVVGVFDSKEKAALVSKLPDNLGSEVEELELNVEQKIRWREVPVPNQEWMNDSCRAAWEQAVKELAYSNPYIKLLEGDSLYGKR